MKIKLIHLAACLLFISSLPGCEKQTGAREHALRYFEGEAKVVRASVDHSYFWQTEIHQCPVCTGPVNEIITVFKVEESYAGDVPVGAEICCVHRSQVEKSLKQGDMYIFPISKPVDNVQYLDTGVLVPAADIPKRWR